MRITITIKRKHIDYLKRNLGAPFIIAFQILLVSAAIYLAVGAENIANQLAIYAYYSLVIGVFLQLASFIREERRRQK